MTYENNFETLPNEQYIGFYIIFYVEKLTKEILSIVSLNFSPSLIKEVREKTANSKSVS